MSGKHGDDDRDGTINRNDPDSPLYEPTADEMQAAKADRSSEASAEIAELRSLTAAAASPVAWGLDAAGKISLATMSAEGASFVCLYLAPGGTSSWKVRSLADVHDYLAAGYSVVFNWEATGTPTGGWATGVSAAQQSQAQLNAYRGHCSACAAKISAATPIYFNFADLESPNHTDLANATKGAASVVGLARTGGYGGYATIKWLFDQGLITWGWQTYAWSSGNRDPRAQLYQRLNTSTIDYDVAYAADYGQVPRPGGAPTSAPSPRSRLRMIPLPATSFVDSSGKALDPNSDPASWPERNYDVYFDAAGGWEGQAAVAFGAQDFPGRTKDPTRGFLRLASWINGDRSLTAVNTALSGNGTGQVIWAHDPTGAVVAPAGAVGITFNYAAPAGAGVSVGRST